MDERFSLISDFTIEVERQPLGKLIDRLNAIIGTKGDFDMNGYQCDFWVTWILPEGRRIQLSGDLWYQETMTLVGESVL